jgi:hypothetical protein
MAYGGKIHAPKTERRNSLYRDQRDCAKKDDKRAVRLRAAEITCEWCSQAQRKWHRNSGAIFFQL